MMTADSIPAGAATAYGTYLQTKTQELAEGLDEDRGRGRVERTQGVAERRGDYFAAGGLSATGEPVEAPGRWHMATATLERLGLAPGAVVERDQLVALLEGLHPTQAETPIRRATATQVRDDAGNPTGETQMLRAGGIDLTFSAPKSVSVTYALAGPEQQAEVLAAHHAAVTDALAYVRGAVPCSRERVDGEEVMRVVKDLVAAEFVHTTSRGVAGATAAPDPQLHSHVALTGVVRQDGEIGAVYSPELMRGAREGGAYYRAALAGHLEDRGYVIQAGTGKDGRYWEIAGWERAVLESYSGRSTEVAAASAVFEAAYGRPPARQELRDLKRRSREAKTPESRADVVRSWVETGASQGVGRADAERRGHGASLERRSPWGERVERELTDRRATFDGRELRAVALEQGAGTMRPAQAIAAVEGLIASGQVLGLEDAGGRERYTTRRMRGMERAVERHAHELARAAGRSVGEGVRQVARQSVEEQIGAPLSPEQRAALATVTADERLAVLVGQAGTGKGVVLEAAARAELAAGGEVYGVAVAGRTAQRLGPEGSALEGRTMSIDALLARTEAGNVALSERSTIYLDEAGMADTERLERLLAAAAAGGAKVVTIGDGRQLASIGAGGMFEGLPGPRAELSEIHRTTDPEEQVAWRALRDGRAAEALAHYERRGALAVADTRDQAREGAVQRWAALTLERPVEQVVILVEGSNAEVERAGMRAQALRAERGELGAEALGVPERPYELRAGDRVTFRGAHGRGQGRVENGSAGEVLAVYPEGDTASIRLDGSAREVAVTGAALGRTEVDEHGEPEWRGVELGYASTVYRAQGATVERAVIVGGDWRAERASSYVQLSRARAGSELHVARADLGAEGSDRDRIERLAARMERSSGQTPSIEHRLSERAAGLAALEQEEELEQSVGRGMTA